MTVHGADRLGIVARLAGVIAEAGGNITDLTTRLISPHGSEPLYAMMLEVVVPPGLSAEKVEESLRAVREREGVELTFRELEQDAL